MPGFPVICPFVALSTGLSRLCIPKTGRAFSQIPPMSGPIFWEEDDAFDRVIMPLSETACSKSNNNEDIAN
jgi:hypothetical protein